MATTKTEKPIPGSAASASKRSPNGSTYLGRLAPFLSRITKWAEDQYATGRFDKDVTDEELASRDKLRKVLADFPATAQVKG